MECKILRVNTETAGDKQFLESVSAGLNEFTEFNISHKKNKTKKTSQHTVTNT